MAAANVNIHTLRHENSMKYRAGEVENPVIRLRGLDVNAFVDNVKNIVIAADWMDIGLRPFQILLDVDEAKFLRDRLNKLLDSK